MTTASLREFIESPVPNGIGQSVEWTYAALKTAKDLGDERIQEALGLLDKQLGESAAKIFASKVAEAVPTLPEPMSPAEAGAKGGRGQKAAPNGRAFSPGSNSAATTLARLKRDHPKLAARVVAGELSANAAALEAGFRKKPKHHCPKCGHEWRE